MSYDREGPRGGLEIKNSSLPRSPWLLDVSSWSYTYLISSPPMPDRFPFPVQRIAESKSNTLNHLPLKQEIYYFQLKGCLFRQEKGLHQTGRPMAVHVLWSQLCRQVQELGVPKEQTADEN